MRSTNLAFPPDYLYSMVDNKLFDSLTDDYIFKCDNYAVAYNLIPFLNKIDMCEHSDIVDDCWWPYSYIIFFTCLPKDVQRILCMANRIPSSIKANCRVYYTDEDTGEDIEIW